MESNREKKTGTDQYAAFMRRILKSYGKKARAGELDTTALEQMAALRVMVDEQTAELVAVLRTEAGGQYSWQQIGDALGLTRSAAFKRYGHLDSGDARRVGGQPLHLR